ncbi:MAG: response regulator transcription factor [Bdellovibrionaceae bacterium]|nr:response regulator transcription factor [Pseudobdellovibrionaceae bacterium]
MDTIPILLIDDDVRLGDLLKDYFMKYGLALTQALKPSDGLLVLKNKRFDVIILDVMLPEMDGFETFKKIRFAHQIPVIMLTARGEVMDRVIGLEMGVDDYLAKPFEPRELVARVKGLARRSVSTQRINFKLKSQELELDTAHRSAALSGKDLHLSTYEYEILKLFMLNPGVSLSRDRIMDELRGIDWEAISRSLDVAISRLRNKLGDSAKQPKYLKTVWGDGYCFIAQVDEV